ncbi:DUF4123 domain-containing protein [uncultured Thiodictyon sp.]|uniref:DUF4123 domain-containing protein n=1 Tax=uncultured Thiodictyon sp. TaxID=1846217 RepID=UPI0026012645|nr:DUF4123 domain-containing protein [uncultured Thiodictyon sp.]
MIDQTQVQAFQQRLASAPEQLYALLDGALIPNLLALLSEHQLTHICLLPGELEPELAMAAPYLVQLPATAAFTALFLMQGVGRHWGVLAASRADFRKLRMHFRKFLSVWGPDGAPLYFRYYDPRVLRTYLPTCNADELKALFGPVTAYYAEGAQPATLVRFTVADTGLGQQPLSLARPGPAA